MTLVQCLCQPQCILGSEGGFALKGGEVVELRRDLFGRLGFFSHGASLTLAALVNLLGSGFVPNAFGAAVRLFLIFLKIEIDPFAGVLTISDAELGVDLPVIFWLECCDLALALGEDRKSRGLHSACGGNVEPPVT